MSDEQQGGFRASGREDPVYRRVVQLLLLANVAAALALVAQLTVFDDDAATGPASADGVVAAPPVEPPPPVPGVSPSAAGPRSSGEGAAMRADESSDPSDTPTSPEDGSVFLTPPEEFLPVDDAEARTGPLDLDAVAELDAVDPAAARERLTELGFTGGRSRAWQSATDAMLVIAYGFDDERGAATYVGEAAALRRADPAATPLPLAGVPGASAFQLDAPGDPTQVAFLSRGTTAYVVGLVGPSADDPTAAALHRLAALQYDAAL